MKQVSRFSSILVLTFGWGLCPSVVRAIVDTVVFANNGDRNRVCLYDLGVFTCSNVSLDTNKSYSVAVGDVNGDALLDAVFANTAAQVNRVCLGDGSGAFSCSDVGTDEHYSSDVALGDVNGDFNLDAVFANGSEANRVCLGNGAGAFSCSN